MPTPVADSFPSASDANATDSPEDSNLRSQYHRLIRQCQDLKAACNFKQAAVIQAAINLAAGDRALALQLTRDSIDTGLRVEKFKVLASWSGWTIDQMVNELITIQTNFDLTGMVTEADRALALAL